MKKLMLVLGTAVSLLAMTASASPGCKYAQAGISIKTPTTAANSNGSAAGQGVKIVR